MARGSSVSSRRVSVTSAPKVVSPGVKKGMKTPPSHLTSLLTGVSSLLTDWDYFPWLTYIIIALEALLGLVIIFVARESRLLTLDSSGYNWLELLIALSPSSSSSKQQASPLPLNPTPPHIPTTTTFVRARVHVQPCYSDAACTRP